MVHISISVITVNPTEIPITWYFELHHVRTFFSVWRHDFFVLRDVHSPHVYLQMESLPGVLRVKKNTPNLS